MRIFKTLQELLDYIPNCVICQKQMKLSIEGYHNPVNPKKNYTPMERVYFRMELKEGILRSKYKGHNIAIDPTTNLAIEGVDVVNHLMNNTITIKKCCPTCVFKSISVYQSGNTKKTNYFPPVSLRNEELNYTMKGGKRVNISKHYGFIKEDEEAKCFISYNNSSLPPIALDFDKLTDLDQISKKIKTIATFG